MDMVLISEPYLTTVPTYHHHVKSARSSLPSVGTQTRPTILQVNLLVLGIDLGNLAVLTKSRLLGLDRLGHCDPDAAGAAVCREAEGSVGPPVSSHLTKCDIADQKLDIGCSNAFSNPSGIHLEAV